MKKAHPLDRPLERKGRGEVSQAAFGYLFSEMVQMAQQRSGRVSDLEERLAAHGRHVGARVAELLPSRARPGKRETSLVAQLSFIVTVVWKHLFGKAADNLEKSLESPLEYYLVDMGAVVASFVSLPKGLESFSCAAFMAGIVQGILDASGFTTEKVQAHEVEEGRKTVILVRFLPSTIARDALISGQ